MPYRIVSLATLLFITVILISCARDKKYATTPQILRSDSTASIVYIETYDTIRDKAPDYDKVKASILHPVTEYDTFVSNSYIAKYFLQKDREIDKYNKAYQAYKLPANAKIIEVAHLQKSGIPNRSILLWVTDVSVNINPEDMYTCMEVTSGLGYFYGRIHLSLLDTKNKTVINTIDVLSEMQWINYEGDTAGTTYYGFNNVPFSIANPIVTKKMAGLKYHAIGGTDSTDGKAVILYLDDYNGDGDKLEFALYKQESCVFCSSILYGYTKKQDRLINYLTHYQVLESVYDKHERPLRDTSYKRTDDWVGHNYIYKADKNGNIKYVVDYRGRGGNLVYDSVHYNKEKEWFDGVLDMRYRAEDDTTRIPYFAPPERLK